MIKEQVEVEERAVRYIAKAADGSMRDALSLLDQCIAFHIGEKLPTTRCWMSWGRWTRMCTAPPSQNDRPGCKRGA